MKGWIIKFVPQTPFITKGFSNFATLIERCPSGLRSTLGKRVYGNVSGVRIPSSLQNINKLNRPESRDGFLWVTRDETCFDLAVSNKKRKAPKQPIV